MARQLNEIELRVECDDTGDPQSAKAHYRVSDGDAHKWAEYEVPSAEFTKTFHSATPAAGEFWTDLVATIKSNEGIS